MKRRLLSGMLIFVSAMVAGCNNAQQEKQIAIVNISQVFQESEAAKAGMKYLEDIGDEIQKKFIELQQEAEANPSDVDKQKNFTDVYEEMQGRLHAEQQQVLTRINDTFQQAVDTYREKNNIGVILRSDQVVSCANRYDITQAIVETMNKLKLEFTPIAPAEEKNGSNGIQEGEDAAKKIEEKVESNVNSEKEKNRKS